MGFQIVYKISHRKILFMIFVIKIDSLTKEFFLVAKVNISKVASSISSVEGVEKLELDFYTCCWVQVPVPVDETAKHCSKNSTYNRTCLVVGGKLPLLLVVDVENRKVVAKIEGHGKAVMQAAANPVFRNCFATASEDTSVRVWRLHHKKISELNRESKTESDDDFLVVERLYILAGSSTSGRGGHRASVLSLAWSPDGCSLCTTGMDFQVKIWSGLLKNGQHEGSESQRCVLRRNADRNSGDILHEYIDCVRWISPGLLAVRGSAGRIRFLSAPSLEVLAECRSPSTEAIWFIKFAVFADIAADGALNLVVAVGDHRGKIHLFHLNREKFASLSPVSPAFSYRVPGIRDETVHIRDLSFTESGDLIGVIETGKVFFIPK